jgi:hypothetical protein
MGGHTFVNLIDYQNFGSYYYKSFGNGVNKNFGGKHDKEY